MAIHVETEREGSQGITKQFEMSAASMLFDNLQKNQYQFPEKSTIRELVSNGVDATREKLTALKILSGQNKPEDFYVKKEGGLFADSSYLPEYYDAKWLSTARNDVEIIYEEDPNSQRDTLRIVDAGVGIGHIINPVTRQSRLQGCLKLGYSTKRASNVSMGKFGIGAKSALSTGVDSYTMITRHNGKEFRFEIYDYKADPLVPRLNMITEAENPHVLFEDWEKYKDSDGFEHWRLLGTHTVYYLPTDQMNGTEIIVKTKKHHRNTYMQAVKAQMLYMKDVTFTVIKEDGTSQPVDFKAKIKFENEHFIISQNDQFSKPHFVVNGVNYGFVNYQELELEDKTGSIAFKVDPDKVSINPSRETFIWDDKTRSATLAMNNLISTFATEMVQEELNEDDLFEWIKKCAVVLGASGGSNSLVDDLAGMVDRESIKAVYPRNPRIKYSMSPTDFFVGIEVIKVTATTRRNNMGETVGTLKREKVITWGELNKPTYMQAGDTSNKREMLLLQKHPEGFVKLKVSNYDRSSSDILSPEEEKEKQDLMSSADIFRQWKDDRNMFLNLLNESPTIINYDSIEVPKGSKADDENDSDESAEVTIKGMTPAEQREIQGKTVCMYPRFTGGYSKNHSWVKEEPVIKDLMFSDNLIVYGFQEDEAVINLLANMLHTRTGDGHDYSKSTEFYSDRIKLIRVSKASAKHFRKHVHVQDFLLNIDPKTRTISMDNLLVKWHTGRKIDEVLPRMKFLENFGTFNQEIKRMYEDLKRYKNQNYRSLQDKESVLGCDPEMVEAITDYANKVIELQLYISKHPGNTDGIAAQARALFETPKEEETFTNAIGVDLEIYNKLEAVLEYIQPLENILNYVSPLIEANAKISDSLDVEIREILFNKGITRI